MSWFHRFAKEPIPRRELLEHAIKNGGVTVLPLVFPPGIVMLSGGTTITGGHFIERNPTFASELNQNSGATVGVFQTEEQCLEALRKDNEAAIDRGAAPLFQCERVNAQGNPF